MKENCKFHKSAPPQHELSDKGTKFQKARPARRIRNGSIAATFAAALLAMGLIHFAQAEECSWESCTPLNCPLHVPTPGAAISPYDPTNGTVDQKFVESLWGSFGADRPLDINQIRNESTNFGLLPVHNSNDSHPTGDYPNEFAPLVSQGVFEADMWGPGDQDDDYAPRLIFHSGGTFSALSNVDSGLNKSRVENQELYPFDGKYFFGSINRAILLRGMSKFDNSHAIGIVGTGMTAFHNDLGFEDGTEHTGDNRYRQMHARQVSGAEINALISSAHISAESAPGVLTDGVDARDATHKEDDDWTRSPAVIDTVYGTQSTVWLDNKKTDIVAPDASECYGRPHSDRAGFVNAGIAKRANIAALVDDSWVNADTVVGLETNIIFPDNIGFFTQDGAHLCGDSERCQGSVVRHAFGIRVTPLADPCDIVESYTGLYVADSSSELLSPTTSNETLRSMNYSNGGGAPIVTPRIVGLAVENQSYLSDNNASIVSRGKVVLGDGHSISSGYDTDVVHIRDVMHLAPRNEPPAFDDTVAPHERVGLVYYDLSRNTLRVSTAALEEGQDFENLDPREATIVWRDIALVDETVTPSEDVRHGGAEPAALSSASREDVLAASERAKDVAGQGRSPYVSPQLTPVIPEEGVRVFGGESVVPVLVDGLSGDFIRYYWRLKKGGVESGSSPWTQIDRGRIEETPGLSDTSSVVILTPQFDERAMSSLEPSRGDILELTAIDAQTGQVAGTSLRLTHVE